MTYQKAFWELKKTFSDFNDGLIYQILEFLSGENKTWLIENWEKPMTNLAKFAEIYKLLLSGYPFAYISKNKTFLGHDFYVDESVLIPRDETELLVQEATKWLKQYPDCKVLDLCSGSGIIGLTIKMNHPGCQVTLSDLSAPAQIIAAKNAQKLNLDVAFLTGDFLEPSLENHQKYNLITCNPPYVDKTDKEVGASTIFEPEMALYPPDLSQPLYFYEILFRDVFKIINKGKPFALLLEFGYDQKEKIEKIIFRTSWLKGSNITFFQDWAGKWRFVKIEGELKE
ncbi:release factor glutamine methyltransferase [Entomoplasma freundtii]|uniref:peptide chain release factor N(5)-glutamine methyltransferase n=1 Tax=Entomoplasma freundtii TaxID=74700 RepID=A0A2K8NQL9_9MOLU|nr:peptide chain release factor N(5)-glutamine methyltransferase [Entomoplasma freundtii]ATZ16119.1 N5-glutamine S-adenosyl-L-methionine-dependent methyltransferase [Entomoplasma freundtii]TDY56980.1 release factor glutamine methyltransferase [Entomoplasma freundtii]